MQLTASIFGWVVVAGVLFSAANYFFKLLSRKWVAKTDSNLSIRKKYLGFLKGYLRFHPFIGFMTSIGFVVHFILQYLNWGFFLTGVIAGSLLIFQTVLGFFGYLFKHKKRGLWFYIHRSIAIVLMIAIAVHIIYVKVGF